MKNFKSLLKLLSLATIVPLSLFILPSLVSQAAPAEGEHSQDLDRKPCDAQSYKHEGASETDYCPLPARRPVQKRRPQAARDQAAPNADTISSPSTQAAPTYVSGSTAASGGQSEKNIITIDQRQYGPNYLHEYQQASEAEHYYHAKAREYKEAYEKEKKTLELAQAKEKELQTKLDALKEKEKHQYDYRYAHCWQEDCCPEEGRCCYDSRNCQMDERYCQHTDCCPHCGRREEKKSDGGFYLGLVAGAGPNGLGTSKVDSGQTVVNQQYQPLYGARLMGVLSSGYALGVDVMSNSSFALDFDFKLH